MNTVDKRMVEMTIECKCVGIDEALEKVTKLVDLLKEAEELGRQLALFRVESRDRIQDAIDSMTEEEKDAVYSQVGKSLQDLAAMTTNLLCGALTSAEKEKSEQNTSSAKPVMSGPEYFDEEKQEFICS